MATVELLAPSCFLLHIENSSVSLVGAKLHDETDLTTAWVARRPVRGNPLPPDWAGFSYPVNYFLTVTAGFSVILKPEVIRFFDSYLAIPLKTKCLLDQNE